MKSHTRCRDLLHDWASTHYLLGSHVILVETGNFEGRNTESESLSPKRTEPDVQSGVAVPAPMSMAELAYHHAYQSPPSLGLLAPELQRNTITWVNSYIIYSFPELCAQRISRPPAKVNFTSNQYNVASFKKSAQILSYRAWPPSASNGRPPRMVS